MKNTAPRSFLPDFCEITMVFWVVLGAQMLAFVLVLAAGWQEGQLWEQVSLVSLYVQWIALASAGILCLARGFLARRSDWAAGAVSWLVMMGLAALGSEIAHLLGDAGPGFPALQGGGRAELLTRSLGVTGIVGAALLRYLYLHDQWRRQQVARAEARFEALQARIRPHFLFNSMNTVASLTRSDPERAEWVVLNLADLFRAALSDPDGGSSLGRELELTRQYLEVEQVRLGERLRVEWDLESLPEDAPLPLLVIQPLVENAVYHGIEPAAEPGVIRIAGRHRNGRVNLSIRNSLPRTPPGTHRKGNRIALENVRQRLQALYPDQAVLALGQVDEEFQVRVVFPWSGREPA